MTTEEYPICIGDAILHALTGAGWIDMPALPVMRGKTQRAITAYVAEHPGQDTNAIAGALGYHIRTMINLLGRLERSGVLRKEHRSSGSNPTRWWVDKGGDAE